MVQEVLRNVRGVRLVGVREASAALSGKLVAGLDQGGLFDSAGHFRTLPGLQDADGFFVAVLEMEPKN